MTASALTRYRCDWCHAGAHVRHSTNVSPTRPSGWVRAEVGGAPRDLCALCAEALQRALQGELWLLSQHGIAGRRAEASRRRMLWSRRGGNAAHTRALAAPALGRMLIAGVVVAVVLTVLTAAGGERQAS